MTRFDTSLRAILLAGTTAFLAPLPALAVDADTFGERLKIYMSAQGTPIEWGAIEETGNGFRVTGLRAVAPTGNEMPIGDMTADGVSEHDDVIAVETLSVAPFSFDAEGLTVEVGSIVLEGLLLPPDESDEVPFYDTATLDGLTASSDGRTVFSMGEFAVDVERDQAGALSFTGMAESFEADLAAIDEPQSRAVISALGYSDISGSLAMSGSWNPADGRTMIDSYDVTIDEAGTLGISVDVGGYTRELMRAVQEIQERAAAAPDDAAQGLAMLGLMQQLTFHGATIRFEDDTLTGKVLDYFARQQNARPADIANQAKAILPFFLAQLQNPEFAAQVTSAVSSFIDQPNSLTIRAAPTQPVPFALLAAGAMTAPQALPQQLGVTVTAND